ncbi:MAG: hypothetical protein MUC32_01780 [Burkholderiaceae bacterium]|nr:hypothetical protein [Burkholderiaceae bacterium]
MRLLVLALVVLNLLLFAWSRGWLPAPGAGGAASAREPQRLERQVRPDAVRLVVDPTPAPPTAGADAAASAVEPGGAAVCLEAGPFDVAEAERTERALALLPAGSWRRVDANGGVMLRVDAADASISAQLQALGAGGLTAGFGPCAAR